MDDKTDSESDGENVNVIMDDTSKGDSVQETRLNTENSLILPSMLWPDKVIEANARKRKIGNEENGEGSTDKGGDDSMCSEDLRDSFGLKNEYLTSLGIKPPLEKWVHVANFRCDKSELKEVLELAGHVVICSMITNRVRYAKVMYSHPLEAVQAVSMLNGQTYYGQKLQVTMVSCPSDTIVLPKGLLGVGPGLGVEGRPLRDVVKQYRMHVKRQFSLLDKSLFDFDNDSRTDMEDRTSNNSEQVFLRTIINDAKYMRVEDLSVPDSGSANDNSKRVKHSPGSPEPDTVSEKNSQDSSEKEVKVLNEEGQKPIETIASRRDVREENSGSQRPNSVEMRSPNQEARPQSPSPGASQESNNSSPSPNNQQSNPSPNQRPDSSRSAEGNGQSSNASSNSSSPQLYPSNMQHLLSQMMPPPASPSGPFGIFRPAVPPVGPMGHPMGPMRSGVPEHQYNPHLSFRQPAAPMRSPHVAHNGSSPIITSSIVIHPGNPAGSPVSMIRPQYGPPMPSRPYRPIIPNVPIAPHLRPRPNGPTSGPAMVEVINLPPTTTFLSLSQKMAEFGLVLSLRLTTPGCALVKYAQMAHAQRCFQLLNRSVIEGHMIDVRICSHVE